MISGYTESNSSVTHQLSQLNIGGDLLMKAGGDLNLTGTQVAVGTSGKGSGIIAAGGAINIAAVKNEVNSSVMNDASSKAHDKQVHRNETVVGAGVAAAGDLTVRAGIGGSADLNVTGSTLAGGGNVALSSTNNVNIVSTTESQLSDVATHRESSSTFKKSSSTKADYSATTQAIGSSISGNNVSIAAKNDITVGASELTATDALALGAGRDLIVTTAATTNTERHTLEEKKSGFSVSAGGIGYSKGQEQQTSGSESVTQVGSVLTGANVTTASGRDTVIQGSTVVADDDIAISAGRNLAIVSAQNSVSEDSASSSKQSGMIGSFFQPSIGTVKNKQDGTREAVTQSGSQLASLDGNVTLTAGNTYTQTASDVLTQTGDIVIGANNVLITAAQDTTTGSDHSRYSKTAIGGTVSAPLLEAVRSVASMAKAAKDTGNTRLKALAAINAASAISEMPTSVDAIQKAGIRVSISLSNTKSESTTNSASSTAVGSTIKAGGNVTIVATGAGQDSNLTAIGSQISGGDSVTLAADNKVNLVAAESTASQHSTNKSSGSSIGVGFGIGGTSNGFTIDLAVSKARGNADGEDVTYTNTHVNGGQNVTVISGGDTTLKGGVITGKNVIADIGGDLNIESLQDSSTFESKQKSAGLNASLCLPPFCYGTSTVGGNFAKSNVNGDFLSVQEQSGIKSGDGGFQVSVGGNTDLKGGVLGSSQAAIEQGKNLLLTGSLSASDLINKDEHSASGFSLSGSVSGILGDQSGRPGNLTKAQKDAAQQAGKPTASGGIGSVSGSQSSVTRSGISGGVVVITDQDKQLATGKSAQAVLAGLDREVTSASSGDAGALTKDWDAQQLQKDVDAQVAITEKFSKIAPNEIADFANKKEQELKDQGASQDEIAKWKEGGAYRTALHAVSGGLTGGLSGALGAGVVAGGANVLEALQSNAEAALLAQGVGPEAARALAQSLAQATAIGVGAAVGGEAGAATGLAADTNNRQLHENEKTLIEKLAGGDPKKEARLTAAACALVKCYAEFAEDSPEYRSLKQMAVLGASEAYAAERKQLSNQPGIFGYSTDGIFNDANRDALKALNNTYQVVTRGVGAGQILLGAGGLGGILATAPASCATGIGCYASGMGAVFAVDQVSTGAKQLVYGRPSETYLSQSLQTLGMSPEAAGWMEAALGMGAVAKAGSVANKAIGQNGFVKVVGANNTIRETVLANIEASRVGNTSSNFGTFAGREALVSEALAAKQSPWPLGYTPSARPMAAGEQFNMVIDANQAQGLRGPGGFGTFSDIPNQSFARDTLAITEQFKSDISFLQRYEVVQPFKALEGPIGPQIDQVTGRLLGGSETTWQLDLQLPWNQRTQYLKPIDTPVPLRK